jgi:hypothetical protein
MDQARDAVDRQLFEETAPRVIALLRDRDADARQRTALLGARFVPLVDPNHQYIELADRAEMRRHLPQPAGKLFAVSVVELEHRHEFSEPSRRHPGAVQRADVPVL